MSRRRRDADFSMGREYVGIPRYVVSLDDPPEKRWNHIATEYSHLVYTEFSRTEAAMVSMLGGYSWVLSFLYWIFSVGVKLRWLEHAKEIEAFARIVGLHVGYLAFIQYVYEATSACTSVVVNESSSNRPVHVRTMDWDFQEMEWDLDLNLKALTLEVVFVSGGRERFRATTWAGFFGVYTGQKTGKFAISINYRDLDGGIWKNIFMVPLLGASVGGLVRKVLTEEESYAGAVSRIQRSWLCAPVYLVVSGVEPFEGTVLTRGRVRNVSPVVLEDHPLIQVNTDHWLVNPVMDMMESTVRKEQAVKLIERLEEADVLHSREDHWRFLGTSPIFNPATVYGTVMCPFFGVYESAVKCANSSTRRRSTLLS